MCLGIQKIKYEVEQFVEYNNNERYHGSLNNLTPADVYFGRGRQILSKRDRIKRQTIQLRKYHNLKKYETAAI